MIKRRRKDRPHLRRDRRTTRLDQLEVTFGVERKRRAPSRMRSRRVWQRGELRAREMVAVLIAISALRTRLDGAPPAANTGRMGTRWKRV